MRIEIPASKYNHCFYLIAAVMAKKIRPALANTCGDCVLAPKMTSIALGSAAVSALLLVHGGFSASVDRPPIRITLYACLRI